MKKTYNNKTIEIKIDFPDADEHGFAPEDQELGVLIYSVGESDCESYYVTFSELIGEAAKVDRLVLAEWIEGYAEQLRNSVKDGE